MAAWVPATGGAAWSVTCGWSDARRLPLHCLDSLWSSTLVSAAAELPQMQLGHSWRPMCGVVVELGINDIFCRSAFKDAMLWYNSSPVTPQFATWRVDMVVVAHNHFCCAECLSRQRLASEPRAESGRAHRTSNGRADSAQLTNDGSTRT